MFLTSHLKKTENRPYKPFKKQSGRRDPMYLCRHVIAGFYNKMQSVLLFTKQNRSESRMEVKSSTTFYYCLTIDLNAGNRLITLNFDLCFFLNFVISGCQIK